MWESMNSPNFCESALMEFSLFLLCMFSPVEYNAAKSLGDKTVRTLAIFPCIFSPIVYSAAKRLGETAEYMDGTLANFFVAFSGLLCTLCHFVPLGHEQNSEKSIEKAPKWELGRSWRGPGRSERTFQGLVWKRTLKSGSLTPSATFFGTPFWTLFEPWAHLFHECSRSRMKNSSDFGCAEFCIDF